MNPFYILFVSISPILNYLTSSCHNFILLSQVKVYCLLSQWLCFKSIFSVNLQSFFCTYTHHPCECTSTFRWNDVDACFVYCFLYSFFFTVVVDDDISLVKVNANSLLTLNVTKVLTKFNSNYVDVSCLFKHFTC